MGLIMEFVEELMCSVGSYFIFWRLFPSSSSWIFLSYVWNLILTTLMFLCLKHFLCWDRAGIICVFILYYEPSNHLYVSLNVVSNELLSWPYPLLLHGFLLNDFKKSSNILNVFVAVIHLTVAEFIFSFVNTFVHIYSRTKISKICLPI